MKFKSISLIFSFLCAFSFGLSAQCTISNLAGQDVGPGSLDITWDATPGATKYQIFLREDGTTTWIENNNNYTSTQYSRVGLTDGATYDIRVRAYCGSWGTLSTIDYVLNDTGGGSNCATATGLTSSNETDTSADLMWDDMSADDYRIQGRAVGTTAWTINEIVSSNSYPATGLNPGTTYQYRVRSRCNGSWQVYSPLVEFTTTGDTGGGGSSLWTDASSHIYYDGDVLIGTAGTALPAGYNLYVKDGILTEKAKVALSSTAAWSDYVFANDYKLNTIEEVEAFVKANKHLPHVPSAKEVKAEGIDVATMDATLLRQIEELWLHMIEMKKENDTLKEQIKALSNKK